MILRLRGLINSCYRLLVASSGKMILRFTWGSKLIEANYSVLSISSSLNLLGCHIFLDSRYMSRVESWFKTTSMRRMSTWKILNWQFLTLSGKSWRRMESSRRGLCMLSSKNSSKTLRAPMVAPLRICLDLTIWWIHTKLIMRDHLFWLELF